MTLYENFYTEEALTNESTLRIFKNRQEVNTVCLMKGELPAQADEIAIDRMYADNNSLEIGDTLESADGKYSWKITGYVALPDYSCLFSDNNDTMFDAVKFGVGIVAPEGYTALEKEEQNYSYSWKYEKEPSDELQEKEMAEDLMDIIKTEAKLKTYIPRYLNQAITFTGEDMGSDQAMMTVLLYIIIVIMAFVFGVTLRADIYCCHILAPQNADAAPGSGHCIGFAVFCCGDQHPFGTDLFKRFHLQCFHINFFKSHRICPSFYNTEGN